MSAAEGGAREGLASTASEEEPGLAEALHCAVSLAQGDDADEAAEVLRCECAQAPAAALASARLAVLEAYLRRERTDAAGELALELLRGEQLPLQALEAVLRALAQGQQHVQAAELLRAACDVGKGLPGDGAFNGVVDAAVRARAYGDAWDVLELLLASGRRADKYFVSILTKSLEASGDKRWVRRGIALVERFIEQQREDVDEIVFNSLLNVLGHVGDMQRLRQTLSRMSEYSVPPSAVTYGTVVKAYGRARDIDAVLQVWHDMRSRCLGVNPVTCGCVLDACVKCGHLDKAMAIFQEMKLQGLHKNTVLYATLIKGLAKVRDLMGAVHLYQEMRMEGVPCNLVTFNSLMDVCVRCGDLQTAAYFLDQMMKMGIEADLITFSTLIKGYSHTGEVDKALALSRELKSRGLRCDEIMFNSLIDGCAKANRVQEGLAVFEDMLRSRVAPSNITFSILVKLHFGAGQVAEAFRLVEDMAGRYRCAPSRIVYTVLLRCCAQHGGPALARGAELLGEMAARRNSKLPDQGMVSAVVCGCVQHADFDTALRLVREFSAGGARRSGSGGGLVPLDCLRALAEALGAHDDARGLELLAHLRRRPLPAPQMAQVQAALAEGRRRMPAAGPGASTGGASGRGLAVGGAASPALGGGTGGLATPPGALDAYCQWPPAGAFAPQPFATELCPQYPVAYLQQLGYHGTYQPGTSYAGDGGTCPAQAQVIAAAPTGTPTAPVPVAGTISLLPGLGMREAGDKENALPTTQYMKENVDTGNMSRNVPAKQKAGKRPQQPTGIGMARPRRLGV